MSDHYSKSEAKWQKSGKYFTFEGHRCFYRQEGRKPTLLLLHGFPTSSWDWEPLWPHLKTKFRILTLDLLGFGNTEKPKNLTYSIAKQADLVEALLEHVKCHECHVIAHDYGATVMQELLARQEDRNRENQNGPQYASVTFLNGGLFPETHRPRLIQKLLNSPIGPLISRLITFRSFAKSLSATFGPNSKPSLGELRTHWDIICRSQGQRLAHKLIGYIPERQKFRERWVGALCRSSIPMRLINGPVDPISGAHMVKRYRELVPNADVILLEGIGHYPQLEDPQGVLRAFWAFHKRLGTISTPKDTLPGINLH